MSCIIHYHQYSSDEKLFSTGITSESVTESLMSLEENGLVLKHEFERRMIGTADKSFFCPIKKHQVFNFESTNKRVVVKKDGKQKEIACQRDVLGHLVSLSYKSKSGIDLEKVLAYPLAPVSVPLSTYDGTIRKTVKSKLYQTAMSDLQIVNATDLPAEHHLNTYFLDLIASIRTITNKKDSIRQFVWQLIGNLSNAHSATATLRNRSDIRNRVRFKDLII